MKLYYEWGMRQVHRHGEELCGDSVAVSPHPDSVILALSDGLGSGVKANILATLTTQIAMHMLENELPLGEVVQTLGETLPVCRIRKIAYSTFAIAQFFSKGFARVVEFDSPPAILVRRRKVQPVVSSERSIEGKTIHESTLDLQDGDWVVFVSDGVLNAGIGGVYPLGWGWDQAARYVEEHAHPALSAEELAQKVADTVSALYDHAPGDDVSVVVIKVRRRLVATVFTGPSADRGADAAIVSRFVTRTGRRAVCGGTTAQIVARHLGQSLEVDLSTMTSEVPPTAHIAGIDLVTEGILTLTRVSELLQSQASKDSVRFQADGAAAMMRLLLEADSVHFLVGHAINPAHQNPDLPTHLGIRLRVVEDIAEQLRARGKEATIESI